MPLGEFLAQGLGEAVHAELGEAVDAVAVPRDAAGDRADADDVSDPARALFGCLQQVWQGGAGGIEQALHVDGDHAVPFLRVRAGDGPRSIRPTLLTRMSSRPNRPAACWTAASAWARSVMSASTADRWRPLLAPVTSAAVPVSGGSTGCCPFLQVSCVTACGGCDPRCCMPGVA